MGISSHWWGLEIPEFMRNTMSNTNIVPADSWWLTNFARHGIWSCLGLLKAMFFSL